MALPLYSLKLLPPQEMAFDIVGSAVESGRSLSGLSGAADFSGGGFWQMTYAEIELQAPDQHRYWNMLRTRLNGGVRSIVVPFIVDWIGPFPRDELGVKRAMIGNILYSDGARHSDGAGFSQANFSAEIAAAAGLNAGEVQIRRHHGEDLFGGEMFSIEHRTKGHRVYAIEEVTGRAGDVFTVAIRPPLREAVPAGAYADFAEPKCTMRLPAGMTMPWNVRGYWQSRPSVTFIESFGTLAD